MGISCATANGADPVIVIELFRGWIFFFVQDHELRIEEESVLFQQVSRRPLNRGEPRNKRLSWPAPAKETHGCQFDVRQRGDTCSLLRPCSLIALRTAFVPSTSPSNSRCLGTLCTGGMSPNTRAPWDEGCSPIPAKVSRAQGRTVPRVPSWRC